MVVVNVLNHCKANDIVKKHHDLLHDTCMEFINNKTKLVSSIGNDAMFIKYNKIINKRYKLAQKKLEAIIPDGTDHLPSLLANEMLGLFFSNKKNYPTFYNIDYAFIYDCKASNQTKLAMKMGDYAQDMVDFANKGYKK